MKNLNRILVLLFVILPTAIYSCGGGGSSRGNKNKAPSTGVVQDASGGVVSQGVCPSVDGILGKGGRPDSLGAASVEGFSFLGFSEENVKGISDVDLPETFYPAENSEEYDSSVLGSLQADCSDLLSRYDELYIVGFNFRETEEQDGTTSCVLDFFKCNDGNAIGSMSKHSMEFSIKRFWNSNISTFDQNAEPTYCYGWGTSEPKNQIRKGPEAPIESIDLRVDPGIDSLSAGQYVSIWIDGERVNDQIKGGVLSSRNVERIIEWRLCDH